MNNYLKISTFLNPLYLLAIFVSFTISLAEFTTTMSSSTQEIHDFLLNGEGSVNAKLVYTNLSNEDQSIELCYFDFSEEIDTPVVHKIDSAQEAKVPVISPDGNWVVFARGDGVEAGSTVATRSSAYICKIAEDAIPVLIAADSACEPRFIQNAETLTVIYTTLAPDSAWEGVGKTMKVTIDVSSGTPVVGTPEVFFEHGSYTGGLSSDGKYLCSGGGSIVMLDLTSGNTHPDMVSSFAQSCNASISSSKFFTNTMMHLSMGGTHPLINNGQPFGTWQAILINNNKGEIIKGYGYPATYKFPLQTDPETWNEGKARWHHCEWSNHPYFAATTLIADRYYKIGDEFVNTFYQERLYLVNLKDSSYIEVLRPDTIYYSGIPDDNAGLHWPWLWVEVPDGFEEDSTWLIPSTPIKSSPHKTQKINAFINFNNGRITSTSTIVSASLYQSNGKLIQKIPLVKETHTVSLSLKALSAGIYLIHIKTSQNFEETFRFVIIQ